MTREEALQDLAKLRTEVEAMSKQEILDLIAEGRALRLIKPTETR